MYHNSTNITTASLHSSAPMLWFQPLKLCCDWLALLTNYLSIFWNQISLDLGFNHFCEQWISHTTNYLLLAEEGNKIQCPRCSTATTKQLDWGRKPTQHWQIPACVDQCHLSSSGKSDPNTCEQNNFDLHTMNTTAAWLALLLHKMWEVILSNLILDTTYTDRNTVVFFWHYRQEMEWYLPQVLK